MLNRDSLLYKIIYAGFSDKIIKHLLTIYSPSPARINHKTQSTTGFMNRFLLKENVLSLFYNYDPDDLQKSKDPTKDLAFITSITAHAAHQCLARYKYDTGDTPFHASYHNNMTEEMLAHHHLIIPPHTEYTQTQLKCIVDKLHSLQPLLTPQNTTSYVLSDEDAKQLHALIEKLETIDPNSSLTKLCDSVYHTISKTADDFAKVFILSFAHTLLNNYLYHYLTYQNIDARIKYGIIEGLKLATTACIQSPTQASLDAAIRTFLNASLGLMGFEQNQIAAITTHLTSMVAFADNPLSFLTSCLNLPASALGMQAAYAVITRLPSIPKLKQDEPQEEVLIRTETTAPSTLRKRG